MAPGARVDKNRTGGETAQAQTEHEAAFGSATGGHVGHTITIGSSTALAAGARLGPYEIIALIGGWDATSTRLVTPLGVGVVGALR